MVVEGVRMFMGARCWVLALSILLPAVAAGGTAPEMEGMWEGPFGLARIYVSGSGLQAKLFRAADGCDLAVDSVVMDGFLMDDSFSGRLAVCGKGCAAGANVFTLLFFNRGTMTMSGALNLPAGCSATGLAGRSGAVVRRLAEGQASGAPEKMPAAISGGPEGSYDPRNFGKKTPVEDLLIEGAAHLQAGHFEKARELFTTAIEKDPVNPVSYNGIGVTWYARNDYDAALVWYKKAIEADPNFGDAYYNIACIYSLQKKTDMALRYLKIAFLNGYALKETLEKDPDLENVRGTPEFGKMLSGEL